MGFFVVARALGWWGKGKIFCIPPLQKISFGQVRARRKEEARGRNPAPPERKLSKVSVRIFLEKSSDFVQDRQSICAPQNNRVD